MEIPKLFGVNKSPPVKINPATGKYPNLKPLSKDTVSFGKTAALYAKNSQEMSDEEFSVFRSDLVAKLSKADKNTKISPEIITRENVSFALKVLSDNKLCGNSSVMSGLSFVLKSTASEESAKAKSDFVDKIFSEKYTSENSSVTENLADLLETVNSDEQLQIKSDIIDTIIGDNNLKNNDNIKKYLLFILGTANNKFSKEIVDITLSDPQKYNSEPLLSSFADNFYDLETDAQSTFAKYLISDKKIYDNPEIISRMNNAINTINCDEETQAKIKITGKLINDSRFSSSCIPSVVESCDDNEAFLAKEYIIEATKNDNKYSDNSDYAALLPVLTVVAKNQNGAQLLLDFTENYYNKGISSLDKSFKHVLENTDSQEKYNAETKILDKFLQDESLLDNKILAENIPTVISSCNTVSQSAAKEVLIDKYFKNEELKDNREFLTGLISVIYDTETEEQAEIKSGVIDNIINNEDIMNDVGSMKIYLNIVRKIKTPQEAEILNSVISNPLICQNGEVLKAYYNYIETENEGEKTHKAAILSKTFSEPLIFESSTNLYRLPSMLYFVKDKAEEINPFIDRILSDEELRETEGLLNSLYGLTSEIFNSDFSEEKMMLADSIIGNKSFRTNKNLLNAAYSVVRETYTAESAEAKASLLNKIASTPILSENEDVKNNIFSLLNSAFDKQRVNPQLKLTDKILSTDKLYENFSVKSNMGRLILQCRSDETAQAESKVADFIINNEKLYSALDADYNLFNIIYNTQDMKSADAKIRFLESISNNNELMSDKNLQNYLAPITTELQNEEQADIALRLLQNDKNTNNPETLNTVYQLISSSKKTEKIELLTSMINDDDIIPGQMLYILRDETITPDAVKKTNQMLGIENTSSFGINDLKAATSFIDYYNKSSVTELSSDEKRQLLRTLVASNADLFGISEKVSSFFPIIPKNQEEYCELMPSLVRSLGIKTKPLTENQIAQFNKDITQLADNIAQLSDEEFNALEFKLEYDKNTFISDVNNALKGLPEKEVQYVYDYFGFELCENERTETGYEITGYPVNFDDDDKQGILKDECVKSAIEKIRPYVVKFSENNIITTGNPATDEAINKITEFLPEIITMVGKEQAGMNGSKGSHVFDVFKHSLKVMQKIKQNPEFEKLDESDRKVILLASLLHDITKKEGFIDPSHPDLSSFDSFFIAKKFNLPKGDEIKLYTLIKHHEWLGKVNSSPDETTLDKNLKSVAYDLRHDNIFDMSLIFTHADLKAVKPDDSFHDRTEGIGRTNFKGETRSFGDAADFYAEKIKNLIGELVKSQPILPVTQIPSASVIEKAITTVNEDGSTNIKGVYKDKDGLVVIKFNEVEDWEAIGFPNGSISKGIETEVFDNGEDKIANTGTIKFIVHGLDYSNQLAKFDAFSLIDSDALLSVSYTERPESKYRFFRTQGVILNTDTKYIHGGGETDAGSGCGKNIDNFKANYIFGGHREKDRLYISSLIKQTLGINDEEYVEFVKENANKPFSEIEPKEVREKIIKAFAGINSNHRIGDRSYNEMYVSNPVPMGVFAYNPLIGGTVGNPLEFLNGEISVKTGFLKEYALKNDMPFIVFGD